MPLVYLDNAATTPPSDRVRAAMEDALTETWGNPSSAHTLGVKAERLVETSRRHIASAIGASPEQVLFTSGGTEANALALFGGTRMRARRKNHIITTTVEHSSVANACARLEEDGFRITRLPVNGDGLVRIEQVIDALTPETALVSIIWVNNETGAVQPVSELAARIKEVDEDVFVHADAVQALGNVPLDLRSSSLDMVSLSGHKIHGPKGIGALWVKKRTHFTSPWGAGSQESGFRPGTENVPGIAGFGAAAVAARYDKSDAERMRRLKESLWTQIKHRLADTVPVRRNGPLGENETAPHILNVSFVGLKGEVLVHALAERNVIASTGSACSSRRQSGSATLRAMGLKEAEIEGGLRFSLSRTTTEAEVEAAAAVIGTVASELYQFVR